MVYYSCLFGFLGSVLRPTLLPVCDAKGIEGTSHYMIPDTWQVLYSSPSDKNDGVLLQIVSNTRDV